MKKTSIAVNTVLYYILLLAGLLTISTACEDEELSPYVEPLPVVHAYAKIPAESPDDFIAGALDAAINANIQWVSIDRKLEVQKIDLYILFSEEYVDPSDNPTVARHGGDEGIFFKSIEGGDLKGNRENASFTVSQADVLSLYQNATYDYNGDGNPVPVFNNTIKPSRSAAMPFIPGDNFTVRWELTTTSGLVFDSWSPSVCTEFETYTGSDYNDGGVNCTLDWTVVQP